MLLSKHLFQKGGQKFKEHDLWFTTLRGPLEAPYLCAPGKGNPAFNQ